MKVPQLTSCSMVRLKTFPLRSGTRQKCPGYKINLQKKVAFPYTNNELCERKFKKTIPFTVMSKRIKHSGINLKR